MLGTGIVRTAIVCAMLLATTGANAQGSGQVRWRFEIPSNSSGKFIGVGADGRVYTASFSPADLYALAPDGSLVWSVNLGLASGDWPITFANDGTIYTGAVGVRAVNPDGTLRWAYDPGSWIIAGPSVGPEGNIYAADDVLAGGLGFFSLDANGNLRWSNRGDPAVFGLTEGLDEIVFGDGRLFGGIHFLRSGPWLSSYAFDSGGSQIWFGGFLPRYLEPTSAPRMLPDGRIAYRAGQGSLAAVRQDGFADWIVPHPDGAQVLVTPAVGPDGSIYSGDQYGVQLWAANPDGTTRWVHASVTDDYLGSVGLGVSPDNRVLIASGWSYFGGLNHGWIRGHGPGNGELLWQIDLPLEQGLTQLTRTVRPAFSPNGDTAYLTTSFVGNGVGHSYLYAINLGAVSEPRLSSLKLDPTRVRGGNPSSGTVVLTEPAAVDTQVTLGCNSVYASVPPSVVIRAGSSEASFTVTTVPVPRNTTATITAGLRGQTLTAKLTITRR